MVTIGKIMEALAELAPWDLAESWDRVGLQVGRPGQSVNRLMAALDLSEKVLEEGINQEVDGFVIHHPLIFKPLAHIRTDQTIGRIMATLLNQQMSVIAAHTNADIAGNGLNAFIAARIGLGETKPLDPVPKRQYKVNVFVPESHVAKLREAMAAAGAGRIGEYTDCSFAVQGRGSFKPGINVAPYIGETGRLEDIAEIRLEMLADRNRLSQIIEAAHQCHPYQEPVIDVYQLAEDRRNTDDGLGKIGRLPEPVSIHEFCAIVKNALNISSLKLLGDPDRKIQRVALCTGSGGSLLPRAIEKRAEIYLTGEMHYHDYLTAQDAEVSVIEAGHWGTEHLFGEMISDYLGRYFSSEKLEVIPSRVTETEPFIIV